MLEMTKFSDYVGENSYQLEFTDVSANGKRKHTIVNWYFA